MKNTDYQTLILLCGIFIIIGDFFIDLGGNDLLIIYTCIVWISVIFSAFIDNIPYTATMLPVVQTIANEINIEPYILYFGLLAGATLGGNLTPVGASANIASIGILKKAGYKVKTKDFIKISIPFTLVAILTGYLLIWILWS